MTTTITTAARPTITDRLACRIPPMDADGLTVERFTVERNSLENMRLLFQPGGRACLPGEYTRLTVDGVLWMSDTTAERRDHWTPVHKADQYPGGRGLVNGLGLGCVLGAMLDSLAHVDVVESDERVARLIGGWYQDQYGDRVTVHHADAYTIQWPTGTRWDVAWHDIWPTLCEDNLALMGKLHRRYGRRVAWQGSWGKGLLESERRRTRDAWWR